MNIRLLISAQNQNEILIKMLIYFNIG